MNFVLQPWQLLIAVLAGCQRLINAGDEVGRFIGEGQCRERFGGLLRYYYRHAA